jgi:hypothetical protein
MTAHLKKEQKQLLRYSEILFKMAFAMHSGSHPKFQYLDTFVWGKHILKRKDLILNKKEEELAIALIHHVATYTLANQIDTCLQNCFKNRFEHKDKNIRNAAWIVRLIRNAFAHNPFYPKWKIYAECENKVFSVKNIIKLDTTSLDDKFVDRYNYGGPLALLRLSEFIRKQITI